MKPLYLTLLLLAAPLSAETLFYASFDSTLLPDLARGGRLPVKRIGGALAPGKVGQALALDGSSYLEFPAGANVAGKAFTIALWFRPDDWGAKQYDNLFGLSDTDKNTLNFERSHPDGRLRIVLGEPTGTTGVQTRSLFSDKPLQNGQWYHLAVTIDNENHLARLFVDGRQVSELAGPGPLPLDPPMLLIGAGWGRLSRSVKGLIDEVVILDHAAAPEEINSLMQSDSQAPALTRLANKHLVALMDRESAMLTISRAQTDDPLLVIGPARPSLQVGDTPFAPTRFASSDAAPACFPRLGEADHTVFTAPDPTSGLTLRYHVQVQRDLPLILLWTEVANNTAAPVTIRDLTVLRTTSPGGLLFGSAPERQRIFTDNGGLMNSGSHDLAQKQATHTAHGALVVTDPDAAWATSCSFVTFQTATVTNQVATNEAARPDTFAATCAYPNGYLLQPGQSLNSEVLALGQYSGGHEALERWADTVMAVNDLQPPRFCPSGWNSWYCYRLTITEDLVLQNAQVVKDRLPGLGLENIQIDHGWQDRDIVGNWVENDRFPHKLPWLATRLREMGFSLGLWTAVTNVSEHAPLFAEHPDALLQDPKGGPHVTYDKWYWAPHGKVYSVDPTSPLGEKHLRDSGAALRSYGCTYNKNDFQSDLLATGVATHDKSATLGAPIWRKGMAAFAEGRGRDMAYHACNAPLNLVAGLCDSAWTHGDIGNPGGRWDWLRQWAHDFMARYHVSGKFYWSDPDYLQVGQGTPQENRVRMAFAALGGGPVFLSDRLPELSDEKLSLITQCLPAYGPCARPLDLFERDDYPHVWDLPVTTKWGDWHVLGLFNLYEQPGKIAVNFAQLNLDPAWEYLIFDYFNRRLLGDLKSPRDLDLILRFSVPATEVTILKVIAKQPHPFVLSTDLHLTQGAVELSDVRWDEKTLTISGKATRPPKTRGNLCVYVPPSYRPAQGQPTNQVLTIPLTFTTGTKSWKATFRR